MVNQFKTIEEVMNINGFFSVLKPKPSVKKQLDTFIETPLGDYPERLSLYLIALVLFLFSYAAFTVTFIGGFLVFGGSITVWLALVYICYTEGELHG